MEYIWKQVGIYFIIGVIPGTGIVYVYNTVTGEVFVCTCSSYQGSINWSSNCPAEIVAQFPGACP